MEINTQNSENAKSQLNEQIDDYILSLHNISDNSKEHYSALLKIFVRYITERGILTKFFSADGIIYDTVRGRCWQMTQGYGKLFRSQILQSYWRTDEPIPTYVQGLFLNQ